jgi:hypothetical protein
LFHRDKPGVIVLEIIGDDAPEAARLILAAQRRSWPQTSNEGAYLEAVRVYGDGPEAAP